MKKWSIDAQAVEQLPIFYSY